MQEYNNKELLTKVVSESNSIADVCRYFGLQAKGGNYNTIKTAIHTYGLDTTHFTRYSRKGVKTRKLSDILIHGLPCNSTKLKMRLIQEGVKEYKCERCHNSVWNGEPIPLELHHINGNHNDNHLDNLQILCPNCHSQTATFTGRNINNEENLKSLLEREQKRMEDIESNKLYWGGKRKTKEIPLKICSQCGKKFKGRGDKYCSRKCAQAASLKFHLTKEEILNAAHQVKSIVQLGKWFQMTDNGIRKWLIKYDILDNVKNIFKKV